MTANIATLEIITNSAVTPREAASYTSGAQKCKVATASLNNKATIAEDFPKLKSSLEINVILNTLKFIVPVQA